MRQLAATRMQNRRALIHVDHSDHHITEGKPQPALTHSLEQHLQHQSQLWVTCSNWQVWTKMSPDSWQFPSCCQHPTVFSRYCQQQLFVRLSPRLNLGSVLCSVRLEAFWNTSPVRRLALHSRTSAASEDTTSRWWPQVLRWEHPRQQQHHPAPNSWQCGWTVSSTIL